MLTSGQLKIIFIISIIIGIISIIGLITILILYHIKLTSFKDYAIVIDAGSSHTTIYIYNWSNNKTDEMDFTLEINIIKSCKINQGTITTIKDPTLNNIQEYFEPEMSDCINIIPLNRKSKTLIFLGGTGGLRLSSMKDSNYTNNLLNTIRIYFNSLNLFFKLPNEQVRILNGNEEGLMGWITVNYLMGELLNNNTLETYGVLDIGGASTQISFISPNATKDLFNLNLFNKEYSIYSHSYLCYGSEQMRFIYLGQIINKANGSKLLEDPCLQIGYIENITYNQIFNTPCAQNQYAPLSYLNKSSTYSFIGTGNYKQCSIAIRERFNTSICTFESCSFDNIYQPKPISSKLKFVGISVWYATFNILASYVNLTQNNQGNYDFYNVNLNQIKNGMNLLCSELWSNVLNPSEYRPLTCFSSMYEWTLFEYGYSMTNDNLKNFHIMNNQVSWTLGYIINQTSYLNLNHQFLRLFTKHQFIALLILFLFILILTIIIDFISMILFKRRQGYSKTN